MNIQQHQQIHQPQQQQTTAQQKRKMYSQTTPYSGSHQPASVARRNARERNRVKLVNDGFAKLRQRIPQALAQAVCNNSTGGSNNSSPSNSPSPNQSSSRAASKKLSKVDTLKLALIYIKGLMQVIEDHDSEMSSNASSVGSLTSSVDSAASPKSSTSQLSPAPVGLELDDHHHYLHQQVQPQLLHQQQQQQQQQSCDIKFELKSESVDDEFTDMVHQQTMAHHQYHHQQQLQHHQYHQHQIQPQQSPIYVPTPNSEASSSPTPSFVSDVPSTPGSQGYDAVTFGAPAYTSPIDPYDNYPPMSPEVEEQLLGYLTMYQWPTASQ